MKAQSVQYTIRGIPAEVDAALRRRAKALNVSINRLIIDELVKVTVGKRKHADFAEFVGGWQSDEVFDAAVAEQRKVYESDWE
jgi:hypothetical protein